MRKTVEMFSLNLFSIGNKRGLDVGIMTSSYDILELWKLLSNYLYAFLHVSKSEFVFFFFVENQIMKLITMNYDGVYFKGDSYSSLSVMSIWLIKFID